MAIRQSISDSDSLITALSNVGTFDELWFRLERIEDQFAGFYSINGVDWDLIGFDSVPLTSKLDIGIYVTTGANASFSDWKITPYIECTGTDGTNAEQTFTVYDVPFNQVNDTNKKIKFRMKLKSFPHQSCDDRIGNPECQSLPPSHLPVQSVREAVFFPACHTGDRLASVCSVPVRAYEWQG